MYYIFFFFFFTTSFFIHSSVYEHLGCLHILTVVNRAAINIGVHFLLNYSLVWIDAQEWDCWSICWLGFFEEPPGCCPQWLHQFAFPPTNNGRFLTRQHTPKPSWPPSLSTPVLRHPDYSWPCSRLGVVLPLRGAAPLSRPLDQSLLSDRHGSWVGSPGPGAPGVLVELRLPPLRGSRGPWLTTM